MKVLIIGLPYFTKKLACSLTKFDKENIYIALDTNACIVDKVKYMIHLINADIVYSIGGTIRQSKTIKLALYFRKKVIMHWVGTDVINAMKDYKESLFNNDNIKKAKHLCEVNWIQEELKEIGIKAEIVQFATFDKKIAPNVDFPKRFSILSYVGKNREEFYGIDHLIKLANEFPDIEIKVVGIDKYSRPIPTNLKLLGWVNDMDKQYKECVLYLRLAKHDGLAFSVLEALANGRYVGYSQEYEECIYVQHYEKLKRMVLEKYNDFQSGHLQLNYNGINYIKKNFSHEVVLNNLINKICANLKV